MVNLFKDGFLQSNNIFFDFVFTCIIYIYNDVLCLNSLVIILCLRLKNNITFIGNFKTIIRV